MPNLQLYLNEFREHLEEFYASLHLAPPYHSIEKALTTFASGYHSKTRKEQDQAHGDETLKQQWYHKAFVESGLHKKHRGIITGLLNGPTPPTVAKEYQYLLQPFVRNINPNSSLK